MGIDIVKVLLLVTVFYCTAAQKNPNFLDGRTSIVHLFEWKWTDIAAECERFLGPNGYGGVQVSPVNENIVTRVTNSVMRPWWERYQPLSYKIITRSGNQEEFVDMVHRCNSVGVRVFVDVVFNHMTGNSANATGTGGTKADPGNFNYPGVPYAKADFHMPTCQIQDYQNATQVRFCELVGLRDLDQSSEYVRTMITNFLNKLIDFGVAGFRVDAAKHMSPSDLLVIYSRLQNLKTIHRFGPNDRPFIYQEVIDLGGEAVRKEEYTAFGTVTEFKYGALLGEYFRGMKPLSELKTFDTNNGLLPSNDALAFVDNHDNQRGHGAGGDTILTYKNPKEYKMAVSFMLAYPYGTTRVMSSFSFNNTDFGPPQDSDENIVSPEILDTGLCGEGWVCEHRWPQIVNMIQFRNNVQGTELTNWWDNGKNQMAFGRGDKGFVAFNLGEDMKETLQTGLPAGQYCDMISGLLEADKCTGKTITVNSDGTAVIEILEKDEVPMIALHSGGKLIRLPIDIRK